MTRFRGLLAEMRRRRVFRVAALYLVGAWGVLQVADLAFESWGVPAAALRYLWIASILGFPLAIFLGWRFDIVDGRIVRVADSGETTDLSLARTDYLIAAAAIGIVIFTVYSLGTQVAIDRPATRESGAAAMDARSIAVLPFPATSVDGGEVEFLALGLQDDLLTRLSRISDMRVISRTSVERYRDTTASTAEIARELGVSKIVEGRIQRQGARIRINVQLIDAVTDEHLWAATYQRDLTASDLFALQTEMVETIAGQLRATLSVDETERLSTVPTTSLEAYTAYLKGRQQADVESVESLNAAIGHYKDAIERDPGFSLAQIALANAYLTLGANFYGGLTREESIALAEPPLALAMSEGPERGEAFATLGLLKKQKGDYAGAEAALRRAIELSPSYSYAYRVYARLRWERQETDEALALAATAVSLDPYYAPANFDLARYNDLLGHFDEALERYLRVVAVRPDYAFAYVYIAAIYYLVQGRVDESLIWYHRAARSDALSPSLKAAPAIAHLEIGDLAGAKPWVELGNELGERTFWALWASTLYYTQSGDEARALTSARTIHELWPRNAFALRMLRDADARAGRYDVARGRYARAFREFDRSESLPVDADNFRAAIDFAEVLQHTGEDDRAAELLRASLAAIESLPRMGTNGYWISDARIFALQGRTDDALEALRGAVDEGWRFLTWYFLDRDPCLGSLRERPGFRDIREFVRADLALQAERVRALEAAGELAVAAADSTP